MEHSEDVRRAVEQAVQKERARADAAERELQTFKAERDLETAAEKAGFIDPRITARLAREHVKVTERGLVGRDGQPVEQVLKRIAHENPYMLKVNQPQYAPSLEQRAGQQASAPETSEAQLRRLFGKGSDSALANRVAMRDAGQYARLKAAAKKLGII